MTEKPHVAADRSLPDREKLPTLTEGSPLRLAQGILLRGGPLIALLLLVTYLSFATPHFLRASNMVNVTRQSAITAILAVGQTFVILSAGIDLSVGAVAAISASVAAVLMTQQLQIGGLTIGPFHFWAGLPIALVIGILAGMLNGLIGG